jgi:multisubunit Na+/H+ antiporter MnhF subunit
MTTWFFTIILAGLVCITIAMLIFIFTGDLVYDKLNALFVMNTNIVTLILIIGFRDGRIDMYIDIALSYAILGFITTVILAKYIGGRR